MKIDQILKKAEKTKDVPNLMLHDVSGSGKTPFVKNLLSTHLSHFKSLFINTPLDCGLKYIRDVVYPFLKSGENMRMIIFDDADFMSTDVQFAMRRVMEETSVRVRYVFVCEDITKMDDALRSRTFPIEFRKSPIAVEKIIHSNPLYHLTHRDIDPTIAHRLEDVLKNGGLKNKEDLSTWLEFLYFHLKISINDDLP